MEISTGKLLLLEYTESFTISPINPDAASFDAIFVTPSAKKERVSIKREKVSIKKERTSVIKNEPDMITDMGGDDNDNDNELVYIFQRMAKKRRVHAVDDVNDVNDDVLDNVEVIEEVKILNMQSQETTSDLPQTCDFTKDSIKDELDRGETDLSTDLLADISPDLLADISTDLLADSLRGREQEIKWVASLK